MSRTQLWESITQILSPKAMDMGIRSKQATQEQLVEAGYTSVSLISISFDARTQLLSMEGIKEKSAD